MGNTTVNPLIIKVIYKKNLKLIILNYLFNNFTFMYSLLNIYLSFICITEIDRVIDSN